MSTESKSETPRTDAALKTGTNAEQLCEALDRSRQLEKELNEANDRFQRQRKNYTDLYDAVVGEGSSVGDMNPVETATRQREERNTLAKELAEAEQALEKGREFICIEHGGHFSCPECAKENKMMRDALEQCHPAKVWDMARGFYSHNVGASVANHKENCKLVDAALKGHDTTNLIVLTRNELIAEIERMPCGCGFIWQGVYGNPEALKVLCGDKCHRCKWIAELKGQA